MSDDVPLSELPVHELVELSSLGDEDVRDHRVRTPPAIARRLLADLSRQLADEAGPLPEPRPDRPETVTPYLFLSHARDGDGRERSDIRRFFQQLCTYLSQLATDIVPDERSSAPVVVPGYLAGDTSASGHRPMRLLSALASCRVFVPLLSPAYLADPRCRTELASFQRRDEVRRRHHPFGLSAIVPILWAPPAELDVPPDLADGQLVDATLGEDYAARGLRALMAESSPAYPKTVFRIARRVHDVAECLPGGRA